MDTELTLLHEIDDQLLMLTQKINLLKYLNPTNLAAQRERFLQANGEYDPQFTYDFPDKKDVALWIQELQDMQSNYFADKKYIHPIGKLLSDKIQENLLTANLLLAYCTQDFVNIAKYNTLLFGEFDPEILQQATEILHSYREPTTDIRGDILTGDEIQQYILDYIQKHGITGVELIPLSRSASKFVVAFGKNICHLYYSPQMKVRKYALEADLIHELQVHYQRYLNGKKTGWQILTFGTKNYLTDEEGLAIYHVCAYKKTGFPAFQKIDMYQKYLLLAYGQNTSFREVGKYIQDRGRSHNLNAIFTMIMRSKQGIQDTAQKVSGNVFLKNKLYAEGYHRIANWLAQGNELSVLMQAKINIQDIQHLTG